MPGKVKVKIIAGKNLPVMDRSGDTTDAYVEIKLGGTTYKTDVCRRTLHPQWNTDWYRFEVDDSELQDEPLQIRVMDHDTYSANDAIGKVYLNLNPLLLPVAGHLTKYSCNGESASNHEISGWLPVYDTMHGIRGEVNVTVKVELFSDFNKFRQSSCGVQFFYSPCVPQGYVSRYIHGFVEELIVDDDPEYQWIDKIRTPRASNEARQTLFLKLTGELQRKIGVKALNLGGNAVIGYRQCFDFEGESGIVARGIGTAVSLAKAAPVHHTAAAVVHAKEEQNLSPTYETGNTEVANPEASAKPSPAKIGSNIYRRSSDSDLSITPKGNSLTGSDRSVGHTANYLMRHNHMLRVQLNQDNFDMLEYPFLTITRTPPKLIAHIGGCVSARSVKLLERISNADEPESRDTWWSEIRMEIRSHARSLNCNAVLGYIESASICDDVCVLSAYGTAALIILPDCDTHNENTSKNVHFISRNPNREIYSSSLEKTLETKEKNVNSTSTKCYESPDHMVKPGNCKITHLPYDEKTVPLKAKTSRCPMCGKGRVPEILIATIEPPDDLPNIGRGCFVESYVCRQLKDARGEYIAKDISDGLPFLEYELHRILINKLKTKGMNSIFSLKIRISVGERMIVGVATGTAIYLSSLPKPTVPTLICDKRSDEKKLKTMQEALIEAARRNIELYQLQDSNQFCINPADDEPEDEQLPVDFSAGNKDCCVLEVDDPEDAEVLGLLMDQNVPEGFHVVNTELVPGLNDLEIVKNLQMFTQIYRAKVNAQFNLQKHFLRLLQSVYFKLRRMVPCALCDLQFRVDLPEPDEIQLCIIGMALGLGQNQKQLNQLNKSTPLTKNEDELIFKLEEDTVPDNAHLNRPDHGLKFKSIKSPSKYRPSFKHRIIPPKQDTKGVDITPLSYVPSGKIEQYLGNLNLFFIRETTSIREEGGLSGFIHSFITEVLAIVRAHVTALGGNAMVAFFLTECLLNHNLHKNQGQCLINVGGDVVSVSYIKEEPC